ncbi:MAG: amidohydrolase family protein [Planctomycetota bacterium]
MLIDFHVHLYDEPGSGEALAETAKNLGFDRLCIAGGDARYGLAANAEVRRQADSYPELFVPFARLQLGRDDARTVERYSRVGFEGLRVWAPPAPYDDDAFFDVYEAAQALEMPVVFHTGYLPRTPLDRARRVRSDNMRPVHLDAVARWFPSLMVVGVGLGHPWCEEAAETMRYHGNVCFDLSGDVLRRKGADFFRGLLRPERTSLWEASTDGDLWRRVIFGSGGDHDDIASAERDYQRILRSLAATGEQRDAVMGRTAARLLGVPTESDRE